MKHLKSMLALLLVFVMTLAMGTTTFAADSSTSYSITVKNTNTSISMAGNIYTAYKLFDATYDGNGGYAYTAADKFKGFIYTVGDKTYTAGTMVNVTEDGVESKVDELYNYLSGLQDNAEALNTFAEAAMDYVTDTGKNVPVAGSVTVNADATSASATIDLGKDAAGYYLVTGNATSKVDKKTTVVAACALTTAAPTAEVKVKADVPTLDKKIREENPEYTENGDEDQYKDIPANTASVGDTVTYEIVSSVPNMTGYEKYFYVVNDTLSKGLTFNKNDLKIKMVKSDNTEKVLTEDTDYTVYETKQNDGSTKLEIVFKNFIQYRGVWEKVDIVYTATVNEQAELAGGNTNSASLTYSNNPNETGTGTPKDPDKDTPEDPDKPGPKDDDLVGETPTSETKTYVTGIKITKTDAIDKTEKLAGAKFKIEGESRNIVLVNKAVYEKAADGDYYMLKDGSYTDKAPVTDKDNDGYNADKYDSTETKYKKVEKVEKTTTSENVSFEGYTDKNGILDFEGLGAGTYTITELVAPNGYNLLKDPITVKITADAKLEGANWTVTVGTEKAADTDNDGVYEITVENSQGSQLPSTGGMGTTIFYVLGGLMVLAAGILLVTRRRMDRVED